MERVFKWFTVEGGDPNAGVYVDWFARNFQPSNFNGIDRLMVCFLKYCAKLRIVPKKEFLTAYLKVDGKQDIKKNEVKIDTLTSLDYRETSQLEEAFQIISGTAQVTYDNYTSVDLTDRAFKVDMYDFMRSKRSDLIQEVMMQSFSRLNDGSDINEVSANMRTRLSDLDEIYNTNKISDVDFDNAKTEDGVMRFIAKTGMPCIDGDIGGIYTRNIVTFNAQPKAGKTRFILANFVYPVLVEAKQDVILYELELTKMAVENILIAYHITRVFGGRIKIPDSLMNKKDEMSPEQLQIYESARIDLFESGNYGRFIYKDKLIVEQFKDEVFAISRASKNLALLAIDYMGLVESKPESRYESFSNHWEVVREAYTSTRDLVRTLDICAVCINQFNDKGIDAAKSGKTIHSGYTEGGHIVMRHTDYDLSMTMTEEQELAGVRMLSVTGGRAVVGFKNVMFSTDLAVSIFRQEAIRQQ